MSDKDKSNWFKKHKVMTAILVVFALIIVSTIAGGGSDTSKKSNSTDSEKPAATQEEKKWDVAKAYAKVKNGMSKKQVEAATEKESKDCIESQIEGIGTSESCNYGDFSDNGQIIVTYDNGKVSSKTKSDF